MKLTRRTALKGAAAALWAGTAGAALARPKPLKVLILGGTGFIGPHFVHALTGAGHTVTLFNRGKRDPEAKQGVEQLIGDRNGDLKSLEGRDWDVVVDNSGYTPGAVQLSTDLLRPRTRHYIFISSIAVYADFQDPPIDEDHALASILDMPQDKLTGENYGPLKVLCERVVEKAYGKHANIIRPTYIAGPGDFSDRFTYWPVRVARGGVMLAPGTPDDPIQYIDVRDLADFVRLSVEKRVAGRFNLCTPPRWATMGKLLEAAKRVTSADTTFRWADTDFLMAEKVIEPGMWASQEIPIWAPPSGESLGHGLVASARAEAKGLKFRSLETTIRETLEWQRGRPAERQQLRSGLTPEREAELLKKLEA
ncbi:MAG TPA: NAD-dependent epimerase/dehydratase family protein [Steroidobacteraceae bacterium]|nr:NAD-dependent epimerase/dehydratase family protein [Steroidobacteraceae bacterium]